MKLRPNNIRYGQDHGQYRGIPSGVEFEVRRLRHAVSVVFVLTACGYGCLKRYHRDCYGHGKLYAWGLTSRQRKRFEAANAAELDGAYETIVGQLVSMIQHPQDWVLDAKRRQGQKSRQG